jgi:hypothetical protein
LGSLVISAKDLGSFAVKNPCQRCLWLKLHVKPLPYQTFPGIFSSIDSYNKRIVSSYFNREGCPPPWLSSLGPVAQCIDPPHYTRFSHTDPSAGVTLRGSPDAVFRMADGSYTIIDYKTARYTQGQDKLMPIYEAQLNGYAYLGNRLDFSPVAKIALIYMEPLTSIDIASSPNSVNGKGFLLSLAATIVPVALKPDQVIPPLLRQASALHRMSSPPASLEGCGDCQAVAQMSDFIRPQ